ncbi:flagellar basal body P-ring formation chaperone FlgA [Helicobacter cynogastricus]|uniref:flagellar basal body P-ring formation chaperone FlgA n=1 Tax=Helicobacter cynogastricus TaxID=329937 RepID=UPI000CF0AD22|nr:flagellar basal body P-ring formation chaperone FlgA [Helicobacter cynogastricus]
MRALTLSLFCMHILLADPLTFLSQCLQKVYTDFYHAYTFQIRSVQVHLTSGDLDKLDAFLKPYEQKSLMPITLRPQQFLRSDGWVRVGSALLKYQVIADIQIYKTKSALKKDINLDSQNTYSQMIPFEQFNTMPIDSSYINNSSTKSFLGAHILLSVDKVAPKILVYKNEMFSATLTSGAISLETSLQALQNGSLNQVIEALNLQSKKRVQVKITGLLKGEVL